MRPVYGLLLAAALSVAIYGATFSMLIDRPMVFGIMSKMIDFKLRYALKEDSPKLLIFAGSNARFSHSCREFENYIGHPCVNLGVSADIGLDYIIDIFKPSMRPGDVVYIPLEYEQYSFERSTIFSGPDAAIMFHSDRSRLFRMGIDRTAWAYFRYDLNFLVSALVEMTLEQAKFKQRFDLDTLSPEGDETGHTPEKAKEYQMIIDSLPAPHITAQSLNLGSDATAILGKFLDWCRMHGVTAVGGLPTTIEGGGIDKDAVKKLRDFYFQHGAKFIALSNLSQYPRICFYDAGYHLNIFCAKDHSEHLSFVLKKYFNLD